MLSNFKLKRLSAEGQTCLTESLLEEVTSENKEDTSNNLKKQYEAFLINVRSNNTKALSENPSILQKFVNYNDKNIKPILSTICEGKYLRFQSVTEITLEYLIKKGADINYFNPNWYCWEAIHYAAQNAHPERLEIIIKYLGRERINTLTSLSENALHILLQHSRFVKSFHVSCQNGLEEKHMKIILSEDPNIVKCAEILIRGGIDVNHNNFWNETPILLAIKHKYYGVIRLLLETQQIDLDSCVEASSGKPPRELLKSFKDYIDIEEIPKNSPSEDTSRTLFRFLKSGDEESFVKFNNGKIPEEHVNSVDGDSDFNSSCTLLQYCFRRGFIYCGRNLQKREDSTHWQSNSSLTNSLVTDFWDRGMVKCIEHLLKNGADINIILRKFPETLIEIASLKGYYPFLCLILARNREAINFFSCTVCKTVASLTNESHLETVILDNTISILLQSLNCCKKPLSKDDKILLGKALSQGVRKISADNNHLLLKLTSSLDVKNDEKYVLEELDSEIIHSHLDECVSKNDDKIYVNYESLITDDDENKAIKIFLDLPNLNVFLNNLVFKIFIKRKWEKLKFFFYLNLAFYIFFYVVLNIYILMKFNKISDSSMILMSCLGIGLLTIFVVKEFVQYLTNPHSYFKEFNNQVEVLFLTITIFTYCLEEFYSEIFMVLSALASNFSLLLLLEQVPQLAKYMIILRTMVFYLKYIIFYFIQFIAFGICFYILFSHPEQSIWKDLPNKIFETMILFTGNLDFMDTNNFEKVEIFSKLIFIIFVIFMSIILNNLLLGLLVTDLNEIRSDVKLNEQIRRARFIVRLDQFLRKFHNDFKILKVSNVFENGNKCLILNDLERNHLSENEKQHFDLVWSKKVKKEDVLGKLYQHYLGAHMKKINQQSPEHTIKDIFEKLNSLEEKIKDLHDIKDIIKAEFSKQKLK